MFQGQAIIQKYGLTPGEASEVAGRNRIAKELRRALGKIESKSSLVQSDIDNLQQSIASPLFPVSSHLIIQIHSPYTLFTQVQVPKLRACGGML